MNAGIRAQHAPTSEALAKSINVAKRKAQPKKCGKKVSKLARPREKQCGSSS